MATTVISERPAEADPLPSKKVKTRKPLKQKPTTTNEANILAEKSSQQKSSPLAAATCPAAVESDPQKENHESLSQPQSGKKKSKAKSKGKQSSGDQSNFEKDMQEMQEMLEKMKIEKEKTEELLKEKDEVLKAKEEELEIRDREQQKLQIELKKLQKIKEFKPTMALQFCQSLKDKEVEKKEGKKKVCPEKKKPAPAYILWYKDQFNEVKKENPDADFKEISNILGAKWKTISPEEKKPYEDKYQADKQAYLQIITREKRENEAMKLLEEEQKQKTAMELLEQYLEFKQGEKENNKKKKEKDPLKPKQPLSAFFLFSNDRRSALLGEGKSLLEAAKINGEEWKNMTEEQKRPYEERAKENKEKFLQKMELYKQKKAEEAANMRREVEEQMKIQKHEALQLLKKKEKTQNIIKQTKELKKQQKKEKNNDPNKPRRPLSSFFLFSKEARKELLEERPGINNSTLTAMISVKWKELTTEEKQVWNEQAAAGMEAYKKELEEYNRSAAAAVAAAEENITQKPKEKKKQKEEKNADPNKPKKPPSSFIMFSKEVRKSIAQEQLGANNGDLNAMIAAKWKELSQEERQIWSDKAAASLKAYKKEIEDYNSTNMV
ncbi:High mobility group B protein 13 [Dionaea muscipula]